MVERTLSAPPARVFAALTVAAELERWFFTEARTDPRESGSYDIWWRSLHDASRDHRRSGNYLEFAPGERLVFEWSGPRSGPNGWDQGVTIVTINLRPVSDGTRLRLEHSGWPETPQGKEACRNHQSGWEFYVENLRRYLDGEPDAREHEFGQKVR